MSVLSKSVYIFASLDALLTAVIIFVTHAKFAGTLGNLLLIVAIYVFAVLMVMSVKGFYKIRQYEIKDLYFLFEALLIGLLAGAIIAIPFLGGFAYALFPINLIAIYLGSLIGRLVYVFYKKIFKPTKNILIVGAGQDGKLIAEEIQSRPELGMKVVGFLDDNMNNIEEEDSSIPILGLTYDSEAVIKDNNVDMVIIAVKSRMDSNILTDLAKGIPLGVKVWRMPTFYSNVTQKLYTSKMSVNWLFYDYVRPRHILYSHLKRIIDKIAALAILLITVPFTLFAIIGIKISDFGPIFFTQTRIGKFGRPFKMIKLRTMYYDKVDEDFDDDLTEIERDDKRIMPFCKWVRRFHVDELPMMINVLKGEMSIIGPRPVREEVYMENKDSIPFWECRNWVRPGWTGWQQINSNEPTPEERLAYDLYYIKHRKLSWDIIIYLKHLWKLFFGK